MTHEKPTTQGRSLNKALTIVIIFLLAVCVGATAQTSTLTVTPPGAIVNNTMYVVQPSEVKVVADSAKKANSTAASALNIAQGASNTAIAATAVNNTQNTTLTSLQNQINSIVIPPSAGLPQSITITNSQTLPSNFNYDGAIYMDCNGCTVTLPAAQKDWHWKIYNIYKGFGSTGAYIRTTGAVSTVNSVTSIAKNSRPFDIQYITSTLVTIK